jgi:hypothetical protein
MRSSRRRFLCCASRAQMSPPNTLMPASSPSLQQPPGGREGGGDPMDLAVVVRPTSSAWAGLDLGLRLLGILIVLVGFTLGRCNSLTRAKAFVGPC